MNPSPRAFCHIRISDQTTHSPSFPSSILRFPLIAPPGFPHVPNILFALEENDIHRCPKIDEPSTESNPHQFGPPTDNHHRHHRKEEAVPHLHTRDNNSKA
jgi:hypothetical protein